MNEFLEFAKAIHEDIKNEKYDEAIDRASNAKEEFLVDPNINYLLAFANFRVGRLEACLAHCEDSFVPNADNGAFVGLYGSVLRQLGQLDRSIQVLEDFLTRKQLDSIVQNNLANSYVDAGRLDDAMYMLNSIDIKEAKNEDDVAANKIRVSRLIEAESKYQYRSEPQPSKSGCLENEALQTDELMFDPLERAFNKKETERQVVEALVRNNKSAVKTIRPEKHAPPARRNQAEAEEILRLARLEIQTQPNKAIDDLNTLLAGGYFNGFIYEVASEAYIALKLFHDAEVAALTAYAFGVRSKSLYINLASLATMRGDIRIASEWHSHLKNEHVHDKSIDDVAVMIKSRVSPTEISNHKYFQINMSEAYGGSFTKQ